MRVTQASIVDNLIKNINNNYKRLAKIQEQISTGQSIILPSDDPAAIGTIQRAKRAVNESAQYEANAEKGISWLDYADSSITEATAVIQRSRELLVKGGNTSHTDADQEIIATELKELIKHLVNVANSSINGRHIFAGQKTLTKPYQYDEENGTITYHGDNKYIQVEIAPGVEEQISEPGIKIFGKADSPDDTGVFAVLLNAYDALQGNQPIDESLGKLDEAIEKLLQSQATVGTKSQGMHLAKDRLGDQNLNFINLLSQAQDLDVAKASIDLMVAASVHTMSLKVGAQIVRPSLVDYLT